MKRDIGNHVIKEVRQMKDNKHDSGCFVDLLFAAAILIGLIVTTAWSIVSCVPA